MATMTTAPRKPRRLPVPSTPHRLLAFTTGPDPDDPDERRDPVVIQIDDERFECCPIPPAGVLADLRAVTATDVLAMQTDFICSVLAHEADEARFRSLLRRRTGVVSAKLLDAVWTRLLEEYVGGPLVEPSDSTDGSTTTSPTSLEASFEVPAASETSLSASG